MWRVMERQLWGCDGETGGLTPACTRFSQVLKISGVESCSKKIHALCVETLSILVIIFRGKKTELKDHQCS